VWQEENASKIPRFGVQGSGRGRVEVHTNNPGVNEHSGSSVEHKHAWRLSVLWECGVAGTGERLESRTYETTRFDQTIVPCHVCPETNKRAVTGTPTIPKSNRKTMFNHGPAPATIVRIERTRKKTLQPWMVKKKWHC